ncbi:coenzyme F420-0:L-glutamate ligase [Saccharopolyspora sp. K220]|uniref:coenzyme F420-0:L-glutamate ligase n=1 Tax=Saccharopolyspora soli TaxID=2926618 RepID=UPI001F579022|nr:coenzyme F420-0:L-glutamate ligase [Saccharopolyspora soli]MCI2417897.1 coenzyme F420-0:L-glutamate ligase [Saccharopolyspora soli]
MRTPDTIDNHPPHYTDTLAAGIPLKWKDKHNAMSWDMRLRALPGIPMIQAGDDLGAVIVQAGMDDGLPLEHGDVVVVAQKVVSKCEDRVIPLGTVTPSDRAVRLAQRVGRDPRLIQLYLNESRAILRILGRHVITLDHRGFVDTAAGVDSANAGVFAEGWACLLPVDPDASARHIRDRIQKLTGTQVAVLISDSLGQPFREGSHGAAIGVAGIAAVENPSDGETDLYGNPATGQINRVDELAGAASVLMGQSNQSRPVVVIRGAVYTPSKNASIRDLLVEVATPPLDADLTEAAANEDQPPTPWP